MAALIALTPDPFQRAFFVSLRKLPSSFGLHSAPPAYWRRPANRCCSHSSAPRKDWSCRKLAKQVHVPLPVAGYLSKFPLKLGDLVRRTPRALAEKIPLIFGPDAGEGLHVTVPLATRGSWLTVTRFAASVPDKMVAAAREGYAATMSKAKRTGKILIDYFRNVRTTTALADYPVRERAGPPATVPLDWKELKDVDRPVNLR